MQGLTGRRQGGWVLRAWLRWTSTVTADEVRAVSGGTSEGLKVLGGCEGQDEGGLELKRGHRGNLFTNGVFPSCSPQTTVSYTNIFILHINIKLCCSYFTNLSLFSSKRWIV